MKIVFLGIDGSGKTTLINKIKQSLENKNKKTKIVIMGWKKNFHLPFLTYAARIFVNLKRRHYKSKNEKYPDRYSKEFYKDRNLFFSIVYYLELWFRYIEALFSRNDYILFDRYFYERLAFMKGLKFKFFKLVTPKPDFCFVLKAPVETIWKRKKEVSKENIKRYYKKIQELSKEVPITKINTSGTIKKAYNQIKFYLKNEI